MIEIKSPINQLIEKSYANTLDILSGMNPQYNICRLSQESLTKGAAVFSLHPIGKDGDCCPIIQRDKDQFPDELLWFYISQLNIFAQNPNGLEYFYQIDYTNKTSHEGIPSKLLNKLSQAYLPLYGVVLGRPEDISEPIPPIPNAQLFYHNTLSPVSSLAALQRYALKEQNIHPYSPIPKL